MDNPFISNLLYLKEIPEISGWGVFTHEDIPENSLIEVSPVILFPREIINMAIYCARGEGYKDNELQIDQYAIQWDNTDSFEKSGVMLGYCSMYNHSNNNNARFTTDYDKRLMGVITIKPVKKDEQVTVSYGPYWFEQKKGYLNLVEF